MKAKYQTPVNPNIYSEGFQRGMDAAIEGDELNLSKINPYSSLFKPSSKADFNLGAKDGFKDGVRLRKQKRGRELLKIQSFKEKEAIAPER